MNHEFMHLLLLLLLLLLMLLILMMLLFMLLLFVKVHTACCCHWYCCCSCCCCHYRIILHPWKWALFQPMPWGSWNWTINLGLGLQWHPIGQADGAEKSLSVEAAEKDKRQSQLALFYRPWSCGNPLGQLSLLQVDVCLQQ